MKALFRLADAVDALSEKVGSLAALLALVMVLLGAFNAVARYAGRALGVDLASNLYIEAQWFCFAAMFLLGAAVTLRRDEHVRVDVLYARLSPTRKAWLDVAGTVLLLVPFCGFAIWSSLPTVLMSVSVREGSPEPGGLPRYPLKVLIPVAFGLVLLQGLAFLVRRLADALGRGPAPAAESAPHADGHPEGL